MTWRDLGHHILERALEAVLGDHFLVQRLENGEQVAVQLDVGAGRCLDRGHGHASKLFTAAD